jgi:hypothetical protein
MIGKLVRCLAVASFLFLALIPCHLQAESCIPTLRLHGHPISNATERTRQATVHFWEAMHANDYGQVDDVIADLTAASVECPEDPTVALLLASSHDWKFQERGRGGMSAHDAEPHALLGIQWCQRALELNPRNRALPGLRDALKAAVGTLHGDRALVEESFQGMRENTRKDPRFQGFVQDWVFSTLLSERDCRYREAYDATFAGFDSCAGFRVPRSIPYLPRFIYLWLLVRSEKEPLCYNTNVAPHVLEGTLLALGDTFLKDGKLTQACLAYKGIKKCPNYPSWPYRQELEVRLDNLEVLRDKFRCDTGKLDVPPPAMLFQSMISCTVCHAR